MFATRGKKELLLQIIQGKVQRPSQTKALGSPVTTSPNTTLASNHASDDDESPRKFKGVRSKGFTAGKLTNLLSGKGRDKDILETILSATSTYNPERDGVFLEAFDSKKMEYAFFRKSLVLLNSSLEFSEQYFDAVTKLLDPHGDGFIDGVQFTVLFVKLNSIRRAREAVKVRERQIAMEAERRSKAEIKVLEMEKRENAQFDCAYTSDDANNAKQKIERAALHFDITAADSFNLQALSMSKLLPSNFRQKIQHAFSLSLSPAEVSAVVDTYKMKTKGPEGEEMLACHAFTRAFVALSARLREQQAQRHRQMQAIAEAEELERRRQEKRKDAEKKVSVIDFDYSEIDVARASQKLTELSGSYEPGKSGARFLAAFSPVTLTPEELRDALKCTFDVLFSGKEIAAIVNSFCKKVDLSKKSRALRAVADASSPLIDEDNKNSDVSDIHVDSVAFVHTLLRLGQKYRTIEAKNRKELEKKRLDGERIEKVRKAAVEAEKAAHMSMPPLTADFTPSHMKSAVKKLSEASTRAERLDTFDVFNVTALSPTAFSDALKKVFSLQLSQSELGAIFSILDPQQSGQVMTTHFVKYMLTLAVQEREHLRLKRLEAQHAASKSLAEAKDEEHARERDLNEAVILDVLKGPSSRGDDSVLLRKLEPLAIVYDRMASTSVDIGGFSDAYFSPAEFSKMFKRTFSVAITPDELSALVKRMYREGEEDRLRSGLISGDKFITYFAQMGIALRQKKRLDVVNTQRSVAEMRRKEAEEFRLQREQELVAVSRDLMNEQYSLEEKESAMRKVLHAAHKYDKNSASCVSLAAFEASRLSVVQFKEALKRILELTFSPEELGAIVDNFRAPLASVFSSSSSPGVAARARSLSPAPTGIQSSHGKEKSDIAQVHWVDSAAFVRTFIEMGIKSRAAAHQAALSKQRQAVRVAEIKAREDKAALEQKNVTSVNWAFEPSDRDSALAKMKRLAFSFDRNSPAAPNLEAFDAKFLTPSVFRDLVRRTLNLSLNPKELGAIVTEFVALDVGTLSTTTVKPADKVIDPTSFLRQFLKMGVDQRAEKKEVVIARQHAYEESLAAEKLRKETIVKKNRELSAIDKEFSPDDRRSVLGKLKEASFYYDRSSASSPSLAVFDAASLPAIELREVLKSTFNIVLTPKETSALIAEYPDNRDPSRLHCSSFIAAFILMSTREKSKFKKIALDKQRRAEQNRELEHERKMKAAEMKTLVKITYVYSPADKESAFRKLTNAAKLYDRTKGSMMPLDGFDAYELNAGDFREMMKRTFNVLFTPEELSACMHHFDESKSGYIPCKEFIAQFITIGVAERAKVVSKSLRKSREDAERRDREEREREAINVERNVIALPTSYTEADEESMKEKIASVARWCDATNPASANAKAFDVPSLSPAVFRDILRRAFEIKLTLEELAAATKIYAKADDPKAIDCPKFLKHFVNIGLSFRAEQRRLQLEKQRAALIGMNRERQTRDHLINAKIASVCDMNYSKKEFDSALGKVSVAAKNYFLAGIAAPNLQGFDVSVMPPFEFKDMFMRTFRLHLFPKELGALVNFFKKKSVDRSPSPSRIAPVSNAAADNEERVGTIHLEREETILVDVPEFISHFNDLVHSEKLQKRKIDLDCKNELRRAQQHQREKFDSVAYAPAAELSMKITPKDEESYVQKMRDAARALAVDAGTHKIKLQSFRDSLMSLPFFNGLFNSTFQIRFSAPELALLCRCVDEQGVGGIDGHKFLNWFYRISRLEEKFLLGEIKEGISMSKLLNQHEDMLVGLNKATTVTPTRDPRAKSAAAHTSPVTSSRQMNQVQDSSSQLADANPLLPTTKATTATAGAVRPSQPPATLTAAPHTVPSTSAAAPPVSRHIATSQQPVIRSVKASRTSHGRQDRGNPLAYSATAPMYSRSLLVLPFADCIKADDGPFVKDNNETEAKESFAEYSQLMIPITEWDRALTPNASNFSASGSPNVTSFAKRKHGDIFSIEASSQQEAATQSSAEISTEFPPAFSANVDAKDGERIHASYSHARRTSSSRSQRGEGESVSEKPATPLFLPSSGSRAALLTNREGVEESGPMASQSCSNSAEQLTEIADTYDIFIPESDYELLRSVFAESSSILEPATAAVEMGGDNVDSFPTVSNDNRSTDKRNKVKGADISSRNPIADKSGLFTGGAKGGSTKLLTIVKSGQRAALPVIPKASAKENNADQFSRYIASKREDSLAFLKQSSSLNSYSNIGELDSSRVLDEGSKLSELLSKSHIELSVSSAATKPDRSIALVAKPMIYSPSPFDTSSIVEPLPDILFAPNKINPRAKMDKTSSQVQRAAVGSPAASSSAGEKQIKNKDAKSYLANLRETYKLQGSDGQLDLKKIVDVVMPVAIQHASRESSASAAAGSTESLIRTLASPPLQFAALAEKYRPEPKAVEHLVTSDFATLFDTDFTEFRAIHSRGEFSLSRGGLAGSFTSEFDFFDDKGNSSRESSRLADSRGGGGDANSITSSAPASAPSTLEIIDRVSGPGSGGEPFPASRVSPPSSSPFNASFGRRDTKISGRNRNRGDLASPARSRSRSRQLQSPYVSVSRLSTPLATFEEESEGLGPSDSGFLFPTLIEPSPPSRSALSRNAEREMNAYDVEYDDVEVNSIDS